MTKLRTPLTFEDAVTRAAAELGWEGVGSAAGVGESQARKWSDPDIGGLPSLAQALAVDAAFRRAGGGEPPFLAAYAHLLEVGLEAPAGSDELCTLLAVAARETGEALGAACLASRPGATRYDREHAAREVADGHEALTRLQRRLGVGAPRDGPASI